MGIHIHTLSTPQSGFLPTEACREVQEWEHYARHLPGCTARVYRKIMRGTQIEIMIYPEVNSERRPVTPFRLTNLSTLSAHICPHFPAPHLWVSDCHRPQLPDQMSQHRDKGTVKPGGYGSYRRVGGGGYVGEAVDSWC